MLYTTINGQRLEYKHAIVPIKCGNIFLSNTPKFEKVKETSRINMLDEDFQKHQKQGSTIFVNEKGGWFLKKQSVN